MRQHVNPLVFEGQKLMPSVTRVFSRSRELYVFLQAYQRAEATTQPVVAFVTLYRGETKAFETSPLAVTSIPMPDRKACRCDSASRSSRCRPAATNVR